MAIDDTTVRPALLAAVGQATTDTIAALMSTDLDVTREHFKEMLEGAGEWRAIKADEFPWDTRNAEASRSFMAMAEGVAEIPDSLIAEYEALGVRALELDRALNFARSSRTH